MERPPVYAGGRFFILFSGKKKLSKTVARNFNMMYN